MSTMNPNLIRESQTQSLSPLLLGRKELAELLSISLPSLDRYDCAGKIPAAVKLSGRKLWRRAEIESWIQASCPERTKWQSIWQTLQSQSRKG